MNEYENFSGYIYHPETRHRFYVCGVVCDVFRNCDTGHVFKKTRVVSAYTHTDYILSFSPEPSIEDRKILTDVFLTHVLHVQPIADITHSGHEVPKLMPPVHPMDLFTDEETEDDEDRGF